MSAENSTLAGPVVSAETSPLSSCWSRSSKHIGSCDEHWNQFSMLRLYLCKGFNNLLEQDDKGDVSSETTGPAPTEVSAGTQISAERLALLLAYP
ncbi:hypothetical protein V6N12_065797 [Hibiscus sabdariffa]|uniref:Uncharacterized protein n=1 Tax=Hibiscus sabdariffa TaxID=183260 RepID=A0ABR2G9R7_9ROSI